MASPDDTLTISWLRTQAATTCEPQCRGAYLYAAEQIEKGAHRMNQDGSEG